MRITTGSYVNKQKSYRTPAKASLGLSVITELLAVSEANQSMLPAV